MEPVFDFAALLNEQSDYQEMVRLISQRIAAEVKADRCMILMLNPRTQQTLKTLYHHHVEDIPAEFRFFQQQITGWIVINQKPFISENIKEDPRFQAGLFKELPIESVMALPIRMEGITIGTVIVVTPLERPSFSAQDMELMKRLVAIVAPYLQNVKELSNFFQLHLTESALLEKYNNMGLVGKGERFVEMLRAVDAASRCDLRVLLEGASGTGKELVARAIHKLSERSHGPFVAIDCGAIPANLVESELMGHTKGAFTDANSDRQGLIESANSGTLFMDEINNLPLDMQAKLLRVLQENEIRPVGGNKTRKVNVRVIAATSHSLARLVAGGQFREDLFYRLYVYPIRMPSLEERKEDIPLLTIYFLKKFAAEQNKYCTNLHPDLLEYLRERSWPGNIRELENFMQRVVALAPPHAATVTRPMLPKDLVRDYEAVKTRLEMTMDASLPEKVDEFEKQWIVKALRQHRGNQSQAAKWLKIPVQTLNYKMHKLGITYKAQEEDANNHD
jgi:transcriptional regulator with GAF, ATPase, and Fis domain